jgi:DNA topoisomerase-1
MLITPNPAKSSERIPKSLDNALDKEMPTNGQVQSGISVRNGPVDDRMDVDEPRTNGVANGKRRSRTSLTNTKSYRELSGSDGEDIPLV